jgi:hypothetical protein
MLARGDAAVGRAALAAFRAGARFDAWDDRFDFRKWRDALAGEGIDPEAVLFRPRSPDEEQPWEVMDPGPSKARLLEEREKAAQATATPSCGPGSCPRLCGHPDACAYRTGVARPD